MLYSLTGQAELKEETATFWAIKREEPEWPPMFHFIGTRSASVPGPDTPEEFDTAEKPTTVEMFDRSSRRRDRLSKTPRDWDFYPGCLVQVSRADDSPSSSIGSIFMPVTRNTVQDRWQVFDNMDNKPRTKLSGFIPSSTTLASVRAYWRDDDKRTPLELSLADIGFKHPSEGIGRLDISAGLTCLFLCSDNAAYTRGGCVLVDRDPRTMLGCSSTNLFCKKSQDETWTGKGLGVLVV
ncbi:hypothetical protein IAU60_006401 [Kwoniella sp. DSM 27419]